MMRSTVRSVGGAPGFGCFWWNCSITVAFAQAGSYRSPSIFGASAAEIRTAGALGLTRLSCGTAGVAACAEVVLLKTAQSPTASAIAALQLLTSSRTFPPPRAFRRPRCYDTYREL